MTPPSPTASTASAPPARSQVTRAVRWSTTAALACSILIIITGGVVRVTGSGLGCPTWPNCDEGSFTNLGVDTGLHGYIEFGNRVLTGVVSLSVVWVIVACLLQRRIDRVGTRVLLVSAFVQLAMILLNAVVGGITVLTGLNPYVVGGHFLAAIALLTSTTISYDIAHRQAPRTATGAREVAAGSTRGLATALVVCAAAAVVVGVVTTGAGPHPGDSAEVHRIPVDWATVTIVHGLLATGAVVLGLLTWLVARRAHDDLVARRGAALLVVLLAQAGIGIYQSLDGLPELAVMLHLAGAAFLWAGVIRVLLATRLSAPVTPRRAVAEQAV